MFVYSIVDLFLTRHRLGIGFARSQLGRRTLITRYCGTVLVTRFVARSVWFRFHCYRDTLYVLSRRLSNIVVPHPVRWVVAYSLAVSTEIRLASCRDGIMSVLICTTVLLPFMYVFFVPRDGNGGGGGDGDSRTFWRQRALAPHFLCLCLAYHHSSNVCKSVSIIRWIFWKTMKLFSKINICFCLLFRVNE